MAFRNVTDSSFRFFFAEVSKFHLRPIKKLNFQFDPFHANAKSVRDFIYHISSKRIRKTSETCIIKTDIVCDRSEPIINVDLHNGMNVLFKCGHLNPLEIAREFNRIIKKYDIKKEETAVVKLKGALKQKRK